MTDWKPPKDEIPGFTSYLYEANRYREPHEYVNYWKWENKATERLKRLNIPLDANTDELLDRIQALQYKLEESDMTPELRRLNNDIIQLKGELDTTRKTTAELNETVKKLKLEKTVTDNELAEKKATLNTTREQLIKYGGHHGDCNIVDALESGRVLDKSESDACTCGWVGSKLQSLVVK